jgi:hypothetical protein
MDNYIEIILLAVLVILVYKKPLFLQEIHNNKIVLALLILLNTYLLKTFGMSSGIIMALILIVLIDSKDSKLKEGFSPKIKIWKGATFTSPCQVDLDRDIKVRSERATLESTSDNQSKKFINTDNQDKKFIATIDN